MFIGLGFFAPLAGDTSSLAGFLREDGSGSVLRENGFRFLRETASGPDIALVQAASNGTAGTGSVAITLNSVAAGNVLVVGVSLYEFAGDGSPNSVTSSPALTFTARSTSPNADTGSSVRASIWTSTATSAGSYTITIGADSTAYAHCSAAEFSGLNASDILVASGSTIGNSSTPSSGSTTAPAAGQLALACYAQSGNADGGTNNGLDLPLDWSNIGVQRNHDASLGHSFDFRVLPSAGAVSANWGTLNTAQRWAGAIAVLRKAESTTGGLTGFYREDGTGSVLREDGSYFIRET